MPNNVKTNFVYFFLGNQRGDGETKLFLGKWNPKCMLLLKVEPRVSTSKTLTLT